MKSHTVHQSMHWLIAFSVALIPKWARKSVTIVLVIHACLDDAVLSNFLRFGYLLSADLCCFARFIGAIVTNQKSRLNVRHRRGGVPRMEYWWTDERTCLKSEEPLWLERNQILNRNIVILSCFTINTVILQKRNKDGSKIASTPIRKVIYCGKLKNFWIYLCDIESFENPEDIWQ